MTSGTPTHTDSSLTEPWRERTPQAALKAKEKRIRERVGELYHQVESARGIETTRLVRRSLVEVEHLLDLAAEALRQDWLGG